MVCSLIKGYLNCERSALLYQLYISGNNKIRCTVKIQWSSIIRRKDPRTLLIDADIKCGEWNGMNEVNGMKGKA